MKYENRADDAYMYGTISVNNTGTQTYAIPLKSSITEYRQVMK